MGCFGLISGIYFLSMGKKLTDIEKFKQRFLSKIKKHENGCWLWGASLDKDGYGWFSVISTKHSRAHRVSWEIFTGEKIPAGKLCLHKCDNPSCVNPEHLFLGTQKENIKDMFSKGRQSNRNGENGARAKLTWEYVNKIRQTYSGINGEQTRLAEIFGVNAITINDILHKRTWNK